MRMATEPLVFQPSKRVFNRCPALKRTIRRCGECRYSGGGSEAIESEEGNVVGGGSGGGEVGEEFADDGTKLVAVTGTRRGEDYVRVFRVAVDDEML